MGRGWVPPTDWNLGYRWVAPTDWVQAGSTRIRLGPTEGLELGLPLGLPEGCRRCRPRQRRRGQWVRARCRGGRRACQSLVDRLSSHLSSRSLLRRPSRSSIDQRRDCLCACRWLVVLLVVALVVAQAAALVNRSLSRLTSRLSIIRRPACHRARCRGGRRRPACRCARRRAEAATLVVGIVDRLSSHLLSRSLSRRPPRSSIARRPACRRASQRAGRRRSSIACRPTCRRARRRAGYRAR